MKDSTITISFVDANGQTVTKSYVVKYNPNVTETVCGIEYVKPADGGPVMRPKNPRY
jgi:hypothetical protein